MVEVESRHGEVASCTLPATEGMVVRTETPALIRSRKNILELLLLNYVDAGRDDPRQVETEFMRWVNYYHAKLPLGFEARKRYEVSGPDAFGVLTSAKCTNEENYLMQKFARQVIGTHNVDHCARLCHSPTVAGLAASFGSGAMTNPMKDVADNAQAILIIGSTPRSNILFSGR